MKARTQSGQAQEKLQKNNSKTPSKKTKEKTTKRANQAKAHATMTRFLRLTINQISKMIRRSCLNLALNQEICVEQYKCMNLNMIWFWSLIMGPTVILSGSISEFQTRWQGRLTDSISLICWNLIHSTTMDNDPLCIQRLRQRNTAKAGSELVETFATTKIQWKRKLLATTTHLRSVCRRTMTMTQFTLHTAILTLILIYKDIWIAWKLIQKRKPDSSARSSASQ